MDNASSTATLPAIGREPPKDLGELADIWVPFSPDDSHRLERFLYKLPKGEWLKVEGDYKAKIPLSREEIIEIKKSNYFLIGPLPTVKDEADESETQEYCLCR